MLEAQSSGRVGRIAPAERGLHGDAADSRSRPEAAVPAAPELPCVWRRRARL